MFRVKLNSVFFYTPAAHDLLFSAAWFTANAKKQTNVWAAYNVHLETQLAPIILPNIKRGAYKHALRAPW